MPKQKFRVVRWLGSTPAIAVCEACSTQFKVPLTRLARVAEAQTYLQEQFDRHKCKLTNQ